MRPNKLKQIWASGKAATNCWLMLPSAISAEQLAHQGWDSLTVDQGHGQADHAAMAASPTSAGVFPDAYFRVFQPPSCYTNHGNKF
jgi:2-keto-3-deoxy-L-rhamnonate aldolase RhmA